MVRTRTIKGRGDLQGLRSSKRIKSKELEPDKPSKRSRRAQNEEDITLSEIKTKLKNGVPGLTKDRVTADVKRKNSIVKIKQNDPKESKMTAERTAEKKNKLCKHGEKNKPSPKKRKLSNVSCTPAKPKRLKAENKESRDCSNETKSPQKHLKVSPNKDVSSPKTSKSHVLTNNVHDVLIPNGIIKHEVHGKPEYVDHVNTPVKPEELAIDSDSGDDSDDNIEWEDVQEADGNCDNNDTLATPSSATTDKDKSVEISIEMPGMKGRKRKKVQEDLMTKIQKAMERMKRQIQLEKHKVHLLMLISVGFHRNAVCNQLSLQAFCMSYIPPQLITKPRTKWQLDDITRFLTWFKEEFPTLQQLKIGLLKGYMTSFNKLPKNLAEVLVAALRSLGLLTRLVSSLQPVPMKIPAKSKASTSKQSKTPQSSKKGSRKITINNSSVSPEKPIEKEVYQPNNGIAADLPSSRTIKQSQNKSPTSSQQNQSKKSPTKEQTSPIASKKKTTAKLKKEENISTEGKKSKKAARKLRKKKKIDYAAGGSSSCSENEQSDYHSEDSSDSSSDEDEMFEKEKKFKIRKPKGKSPKVTSKSTTCTKGPTVCELLDDEDDFEVSSKPVIRRSSSKNSSKPVQILSDESDSDKSVKIISATEGTDTWIEVYLASQKSWFCIDMETYNVGKPELCEENASRPLTYVIGYDNENTIKDVTGRYAANWLSKTQKMRIDADWWEETLLPYKTKKKKMDENEDSQLLEKHQERPLPQSITEYKNHPLYVLKRHLLKFEAIYPETAATLGFIRGEAVYSRDCLHLLHTREKWMSLEARVVKQGELPYKIVKGRVKRNQPVVDPNSVTIDLFGRWQTEDYKPPPAKDGKVPRNEYGNVELFKPSMLPPGTKHLQIPGIQKIAKKLGIDGAPAVVGFDFHCGFCHPVIDGFIVCKEYVSTLMDAWRQEQEEAQRKKEQKREKRIYENWKLIVKSLLIRERLKRKYDTQESRTSSEQGEVLEEDKVQQVAVAWPQNMKEGKTSVDDDGHCHIFPKKLHKKDKVTGEWTKSCACGLTLPLEK